MAASSKDETMANATNESIGFLFLFIEVEAANLEAIGEVSKHASRRFGREIFCDLILPNRCNWLQLLSAEEPHPCD